MKLILLVSEAMKPIPNEVKVIENWGDVSIFHNIPKMYSWGDHMLLEGERSDFERWLMPFDGVWIGKGIPQFQEFEVGHIKDEE